MSRSELHFANPLEAVRTRRASLPALRLLAVLAALALAAALFGVLPVQGQTAITLVSNTGQTPTAFFNSMTTTFPKYAQEFTAGANTGGYTLSSIGVSFHTIADTATAGSELTVTLNGVTQDSDNDDIPGDALCTLVDPATFSSSGLHTFTAPSSDPCPALTLGASYYVVIERANNNSDGISLTETDSGAEDAGSAAGWEIDNNHSVFSSGSWTEPSSSLQIEVRGVVVTTPGVTISEDSLTIDEGGQDSYTIVLDSQPTALVYVDITAGGDVTTSATHGDILPSGIRIEFTQQNWYLPHMITVNAGQDSDGLHDRVTITHSVTAGAAEYAALTDLDSVHVTVIDDEAAAIGEAPILGKNTALRTTNTGSLLNSTFVAGAQRFTTGTNPEGYSLSSIGLFFKDIDDLSTAGSELTATLNENASGEPGDVLCTLSDPASFSANAVNTFTAPTSGTLCPTLTTETTYFFVVTRANNTQDTISLIVEHLADSPGEMSIEPGHVPGWSIGITRHLLSSVGWGESSNSLLLDIRGNLIITEVRFSTDSLTVPEGGSDSYAVVLGKQPTAFVTVDITAGGDVTTNPPSLTFTDSDWRFPQLITVNAAQDTDRTDDSVTITHSVASNSAAEYAALTDLDSVDVAVIDDDGRINICDRTWWLRDEILRQTRADDTCDNVRSIDVENITVLDFSGLGPGGRGGVFHNRLKQGDLRRLYSLRRLDLSGLGLNSFEHADGFYRQSLGGGIFSDLADLRYLSLADNNIGPRLDHDVFDGLSNLRELDLRGFSHNPAGQRNPSGSKYDCWTGEQRTMLHPQYPWNPRTGSPEAFVPLTSLVTYNWDTTIDGVSSYTPEPYATNNYPEIIDGPANLTAQAAGGMVGLRWEAPAGVTGITGYRIERDVDGRGAQIQTCPVAGSGGAQSTAFYSTLYDRLGTRVGAPTRTWFADSMAGLSAQDLQHMQSLRYHVFALTADGESLPVSVNVDILDSFRRWWDNGFAVRDASVYEGHGTLDFVVTLRRTRSTSARTAQVSYATVSVTATGGSACGAGIDFIHKTGTLVFGPNAVPTQTVKVTVCDDSVEDSWETLELNLSGNSFFSLQRSTATGLIINSEDINSPATGVPTIDGTAQAGQTLTASTEDISDPDGLTVVSHTYQWLADDADIEDATGSTYVVSDDDVAKTIKVRVAFTDDAGYAESLTSAATDPVRAAAVPLTASLENAPASHDGSSEFTFEIRFSEHIPDLSFVTLKEHAFTETGGTVEKAKRLDPDSDTPNILWRITVQPAGNGDVTIVLPVTTNCAAQGAICTEDDRKLSNRLEFTVEGPDSAVQNSPATGAPTIGGTAQAGQTLTASTTAIADADGLENVAYTYQWLAGGSDIDGATGSSHALSTDEVGQTIQVRVSFTDDAGNAESLTSAATDAVAARPNSPATGAPAISGTAQAGQTLTAATAAIADSDGLSNVSYGYQWIRSDGSVDADIGDATGSTYEVSNDDVGRIIKVRVRFTDDAGNEEMLTSEATDAVQSEEAQASTGLVLHPENSAPKSLWSDGETLWVGDDGDSMVYAYRLLDDPLTTTNEYGTRDQSRDIDGPTTEAFFVGGDGTHLWVADESMPGNTPRTVYAYTRPGLTRDSSRDFGYYRNGQGAALVRGVASDGQRLWLAANGGRTAMAFQLVDDPGTEADEYGTYDSSRNITFGLALTGIYTDGEHMWAVGRNSLNVEGRRLSDGAKVDSLGFRLDEANARATGIWSDGETFFVLDADDRKIYAYGPEPVNTSATGAPTITGTAQAGQTLTASTSGISDSEGLTDVSYSYQWLADDADIEEATSSTYVVSDDDVGKTIKVRVAFTDGAGNQESLTSAATPVVVAKPNTPATGAPTISGTAQAGQTLTANTSGIADDDGLTNVSYTYQWLADDADIEEATASTYAVSDADVGKTIKVRVSFTDDAGNEETLTSEPTAAVTPAAVPLTVSLENEPASHDGQTEFTFEIRFSEHIADLSYVTLKEHAFTETGGTVEKAKRLDPDSDSPNILWRITVQPAGNGDVTIVLPVTTDCNAQGAICTEDGRTLSTRLELTVSGPGG